MANINDLIDIHADDYALTVRTSEEMLALMRDGVLDSISIVPNNSCYRECMDMFRSCIPDLPYLPKMSVHLNLVEGLSLSLNDGSYITSTWRSLFIDSYRPFGKNVAKKRIKAEIAAQIEKAWDDIRDCINIARKHNIPCGQKGLRLDSHQHTHMIPIVWSALTKYLSESSIQAEYIRNSKEPLCVFFTKPALIGSYRPINMVKNRILYFFSHRPDKYDMASGYKQMYMWGLVMSGKMDAKRVRELFPALVEKAANDRRTLEILFHPGRMTEAERTPEIPKTSADDFYLSPDRDAEKQGAITCRELSNRVLSGPA